MANTASPYGLKPVNLIGGQSFNGGTIREIPLVANSSTVFAVGLPVVTASGVLSSIAATPVANSMAAPPASATTALAGTPGILGVCVGVRYIDPVLKYEVYGQYLPANAINSGYTQVFIRINDDPDQLFQIQADTAVGTFTNGAFAAIGRNAALKTFTANATTGLSNMVLDTGANWGSVATTATLAMRIVDIVTPNDTYPDVLVKWNFGVHSYYNSTGA